MLITTTSVMAYDWSQMRGEVDVRYKNKDERGGVDGSGGASRAFHEQKLNVKLMPFEDSEMYFGIETKFRDYDNNGTRKADERKEYTFFMGTTHYARVFGKTLTMKPEFGYENSNRKSSTASEDRSHQSLYFEPKFNLALNREWSVFTRGKFEYKKLDYNRDKTTNSTWAPDTKLEGGAMYRWNREHRTSASIFHRRNSQDASYWEYRNKTYQARVKHHWKLTRTFEIIPFAYIDLGNSSRSDTDDQEKDKYGMKFKWNATPELDIYGGMSYDIRKEQSRGAWNGDRTKRFLTSFMGIKYKF